MAPGKSVSLFLKQTCLTKITCSDLKIEKTPLNMILHGPYGILIQGSFFCFLPLKAYSTKHYVGLEQRQSFSQLFQWFFPVKQKTPSLVDFQLRLGNEKVITCRIKYQHLRLGRRVSISNFPISILELALLDPLLQGHPIRVLSDNAKAVAYCQVGTRSESALKVKPGIPDHAEPHHFWSLCTPLFNRSWYSDQLLSNRHAGTPAAALICVLMENRKPSLLWSENSLFCFHSGSGGMVRSSQHLQSPMSKIGWLQMWMS